MLPTGFLGVNRPVARAAVIRAKVPDLKVQVRRAQRWIADRADDVPLADALADAGEEVVADRLHVPVERIEHTPVREGMLYDHDAFFRVPAFRVGVGHAAISDRIDRIAIAVEGQVNAGMQPAEAAPVQTEVVAATADVFHRVADLGHDAAVSGRLGYSKGGRNGSKQNRPQNQRDNRTTQRRKPAQNTITHSDQWQLSVSTAHLSPIIWSAMCRRRIPSGPSAAQASAARPPHTRS